MKESMGTYKIHGLSMIYKSTNDTKSPTIYNM